MIGVPALHTPPEPSVRGLHNMSPTVTELAEKRYSAVDLAPTGVAQPASGGGCCRNGPVPHVVHARIRAASICRAQAVGENRWRSAIAASTGSSLGDRW